MTIKLLGFYRLTFLHCLFLFILSYLLCSNPGPYKLFTTS